MMRIAIAVILLCALTACTTSSRIARQAAAYNEAVEWNTNVVTMMNVVRASKRLPVHYTRLGSMTYSGNLSTGSTFTYTLGNNTAEDAPLGFSVGRSDGGSITFENQSSEKFYKAILASISPDTLSFYRTQGWPDEILLFLFIEKIEIDLTEKKGVNIPDELQEILSCVSGDNKDCQENKTLKVIDNDPEDPKKFLKFVKLINHLNKNYDLSIKKEKSKDYCTEDTKNTKGNNGLRVYGEDTCNRLKGHYKVLDLRSAKNVDLSFIHEDTSKKYHIEKGRVFAKLPRGSKLVFKPKKDNPEAEELLFKSSCFVKDDQKDDSCEFKITLRSPHSAIYYLGELLRAQTEEEISQKYFEACENEGQRPTNKEDVVIGVKNTCGSLKAIEAQSGPKCSKKAQSGVIASAECDKSLFYLYSEPDDSVEWRGFKHEHGLFDFSFQGKRYWVSDDPYMRGRTLQMISLLNEIFAQKQEASVAPSITILEGLSN